MIELTFDNGDFVIIGKGNLHCIYDKKRKKVLDKINNELKLEIIKDLISYYNVNIGRTLWWDTDQEYVLTDYSNILQIYFYDCDYRIMESNIDDFQKIIFELNRTLINYDINLKSEIENKKYLSYYDYTFQDIVENPKEYLIQAGKIYIKHPNLFGFNYNIIYNKIRNEFIIKNINYSEIKYFNLNYENIIKNTFELDYIPNTTLNII